MARIFWILPVLGLAWLAGCAAPVPPAPTSPPAPTATTAPATPSATSAVPSLVLGGHTSAVTHLAWSPDGALLASTTGGFDSSDDTVRVWRPDGSLAYTLAGHTQPVTSLAWSPDGQSLATGSLDETIRLWSRAGQPLATWRGNAGRVFALAWAPGGQTLASGSIVTFTQPTVQLWNLTGQISATLSTSFSGGKFYNLGWSSDGRYLLGGATDYKLWRADGTQVFWLQGCEQCTPAWGMAWAPSGRLWAVGDESGNVEIYDTTGAKVAQVHDQASVNSLAWSPDSARLAGAKTLWRADGTVVNTLDGQGEHVNSAAWSREGWLLATGGSDKLVHLWSVAGKALAALPGHTAAIDVVAWSPAGGVLASGSEDGTIRLWGLEGLGR